MDRIILYGAKLEKYFEVATFSIGKFVKSILFNAVPGRSAAATNHLYVLPAVKSQVVPGKDGKEMEVPAVIPVHNVAPLSAESSATR